jgi:cystine transport system substrate-binding protein
VLGQAHTPWRRLLGIAAAASCVLALPAVSGADPTRSTTSLRTNSGSLERQTRSAVLGLYALDSQLAGARARLVALQKQAAKLRAQRAIVRRELRVARRSTQISQNQLASRLRLLYRHGETSAIEILFAATTLNQALTQLDELNRITLANRRVLAELRTARARIGRALRGLAKREQGLESATRDAVATAQALERVRAERAAYISELGRRLALNAHEIKQLEGRAHQAETRAAELTKASRAVAVAVTTQSRTSSGARRRLTVSSTGYALPGRTATGIPVGWGVVAVDPRVIPLGTRMTIPGYGEAVAADTGGAVRGATIDVWFPTVAQALAWGRRSITITLH